MNIAVLGGGVGGVAAANRLRRILPQSSRVTVIERSPRFVVQPSLLWVVSGDRQAGDVTRPAAEVLDRGVEPFRAGIRAFDPAERRIETDSGTRTADAVIISLGVDLDLSAVPGFRAGASNLYDYAGAVAARRRLSVMDRGRVVFFVTELPYKCPPAPYEAAMLLDGALRRRGVRSRVSITVVTPEPSPLSALPEQIGTAVAGLLEQREIEYLPGRQVTRVDPGGGALYLDDTTRLDADVLIGIPPHRCPPLLIDCGLAEPGSWVTTDPETLRTGYDRVFALGDCVRIPLSDGGVLPKAGVFAEAQARVVADNLETERSGRSPRRRFNGRGACYLEVGGGQAGMVAADFYARGRPEVRLRSPRPWWHWSKVWMERRWLGRII
jgi:sulfide:quinone oxidoreductase